MAAVRRSVTLSSSFRCIRPQQFSKQFPRHSHFQAANAGKSQWMRRGAMTAALSIGAGLYMIGGSVLAEDKVEFLGVHTCVPALIQKPFAGIFLHGNYKLPPYVIATGNGERVRDALKYLDEGVLLRDVMRALHLNPYRIEIAVGLYK